MGPSDAAVGWGAGLGAPRQGVPAVWVGADPPPAGAGARGGTGAAEGAAGGGGAPREPLGRGAAARPPALPGALRRCLRRARPGE